MHLQQSGAGIVLQVGESDVFHHRHSFDDTLDFALARDISHPFSDAVRGAEFTYRSTVEDHFSLLGLQQTEDGADNLFGTCPFGANQRQHFAGVQRQRDILIMAR